MGRWRGVGASAARTSPLFPRCNIGSLAGRTDSQPGNGGCGGDACGLQGKGIPCWETRRHGRRSDCGTSCRITPRRRDGGPDGEGAATAQGAEGGGPASPGAGDGTISGARSPKRQGGSAGMPDERTGEGHLSATRRDDTGTPGGSATTDVCRRPEGWDPKGVEGPPQSAAGCPFPVTVVWPTTHHARREETAPVQ